MSSSDATAAAPARHLLGEKLGLAHPGFAIKRITTAHRLFGECVQRIPDAPALSRQLETPYEIEHGKIPQVDPANFKTGIRVVFPKGLVERGDDLLVYYGAADVSVAAARVRKRDLITSLAEAIKLKQGGVP